MLITVTTTATRITDLITTAGYKVYPEYRWAVTDCLLKNETSTPIYFDFEDITPTSTTSLSIEEWETLSFNDFELSKLKLVASSSTTLKLALIFK